jgi:hypothetical protein
MQILSSQSAPLPWFLIEHKRIAHQPAERSMHYVMRLALEVAVRSVELHRGGDLPAKAHARTGGRIEVDVGEGDREIDRASAEARRACVQCRRPAGWGDVERIARVRWLAKWQRQRPLRRISPVPVWQHYVRIARRCPQDAVEEIEIHSVPRREVVAAVLAVVPALHLLRRGGAVVGAVDVGLEPVAGRVARRPAHHHLNAMLQRRDLRRGAGDALPDEGRQRRHENGGETVPM